MDENPTKTEEFQTAIDGSTDDTHLIIGSHMSLIMQGNVEVSFRTNNGVNVGSTMTNVMGAYEYEIKNSDLPNGTTSIEVVAQDEIVRSIPVVDTGSASVTDNDSGATLLTGSFCALTLASFLLL